MTRQGPSERTKAALEQQEKDLRARGERMERDRTRHRRRRAALSLSAVAATVAVISVVVGVLDNNGHSADAESIVNRAPAAARASKSAQFSSLISISLGSRQLEQFTETGSIDFVNRNYSTTLTLGGIGGAILQRRLADRLYVAQTRHGQPVTAARWESVPLAPEPPSRFASAPEATQFTAPPTLLDALATTRSPVSIYDRETIDNVPTTGWILHTNLAAFLRAAGASQHEPASYRAVAATITVWLDKDNRPVRVRQEFASKAASILTVVNFTGYGSPVTIKAPPSASVIPRRPVHASNPLIASPSGVFERQLFDEPPSRR